MVCLKIISYILEIHTKIFLKKVTCLGVGEVGRGTDKTRLAMSYNY